MKSVIIVVAAIFQFVADTCEAKSSTLLCGPKVRALFLEEGHLRPEPIPEPPLNDNDPSRSGPFYYKFSNILKSKGIIYYCFYDEKIFNIFNHDRTKLDDLVLYGPKRVKIGKIPTNAGKCAYRVNGNFRCEI